MKLRQRKEKRDWREAYIRRKQGDHGLNAEQSVVYSKRGGYVKMDSHFNNNQSAADSTNAGYSRQIRAADREAELGTRFSNEADGKSRN